LAQASGSRTAIAMWRNLAIRYSLLTLWYTLSYHWYTR
jgi:hypothetical protein